MAEAIKFDSTLDRYLREKLELLPADALRSAIAHLKDGKALIMAYGWPAPDQRAQIGNLVGISYTRNELLADEQVGHLRHLVEEVFPFWAVQFVAEAHQPLPTAALEHLLELLRAEAEVRR